MTTLILAAAVPVAVLAALWLLAGLIVASWGYEP